MDYGYVYYVRNEINGMLYIGKITISGLYHCQNYRGSGVDLQEALEEYGRRNFSIHFLAAAQSSQELTFQEKFLLRHYKIPNEKFYNKNLATSSSDQADYYNKNNRYGTNLKNIICYNIKDNSRIVFNNIKQFCADHNFSRGCVFNVMSGQRVTHKDCIFWYEDYPISDDTINWILNYKNKTNYKTKYININEVKAELHSLYCQATNKTQEYEYTGYYIEDGKELTIDWQAIKDNHVFTLLRDGKAAAEEKKIEDLIINEEQDDKFEQPRDCEFILDDGEKRLYFNYDEINALTKIYQDISPRLLRQAVNRGQHTVMNKKYTIVYLGV